MAENDKNGDAVVGRAEGGSAASEARTGPGATAVSATDVQAYIGRQLRAVYDDVAKQPIPDRFLALMQQLEAKGAN